MSDPAQTEHSAQPFPLQDPSGDEVREHTHPHDQAGEVAHAWKHFRENLFFFGGLFFPVILTVIAFNVDFGTWNKPVTYLLAAARSGLIACFLAHLFKEYSFVFRTLFFTTIFLAGMIFLSLWDSEIHGIGDPIKNIKQPETPKV